MFTGLVTDVGTVTDRIERKDMRFVLSTGYDMTTVDIGASIACSGVCLTVVDKGNDWFAVDVSQETLSVTTLGQWQKGTAVNFERSLRLGDEMGGHIVSGHVDTIGKIERFDPVGDSIHLAIAIPEPYRHLVAPKGSIAIDGVSLTINRIEDGYDNTLVSINLIPHTQSVTAFKEAAKGKSVNVEFDLMARYLARFADVEKDRRK